jgi:MoaA/NifB/PqqE/SkfB family radical SAM enzyme
MTTTGLISDFNVISTAHFCPPRSVAAQLSFLKKTIFRVTIETSSFCNRRCPWCGNSFIDRHTTNRHMDDNLYMDILQQLKEFNYTRLIVFHLYNEPLADPLIFQRLRQAGEILPASPLLLHTNGDYLNSEMAARLEESGLNRMVVMAYPDKDEPFEAIPIEERIKKKIDAIGLDLDFADAPATYYEGAVSRSAKFRGMEIRVMAFDVLKNGVDRGGTVKIEGARRQKRASACRRPFIHLEIDHGGRMLPCCHLRADEPRHRNCILGDLGKASIREIFFSKKAILWRLKMLPSNREFDGPCRYCHSDVLDETEENLQALDNILQIIPSDLNFVKDKARKEIEVSQKNLK